MSRIQLKKCCFTNCLYYAALFSAQIAVGQGTFQNLNFESATVPVVPPNQPVQVLTTDALPSWTVYADIYQQSQMWYNGESAGGALVSIIDLHTFALSNDVIGGSFTVTLDSGTYFINGDINQGIVASAAIAQTGTIPNGMKTLLFKFSSLRVVSERRIRSPTIYECTSHPNF